MTDQISDGLQVEGVGYEMVSADPELFSPWDYGIEPQSICSSNWSGYVAGFQVKDKRLYLSSLSVGWTPPRKRSKPSELVPDDPWRFLGGYASGPLPALNGVEPEPISGSYMFYANVGLPLDYSGRLIACRNKSGSPESGDCLTLVFESGALVQVNYQLGNHPFSAL